MHHVAELHNNYEPAPQAQVEGEEDLLNHATMSSQHHTRPAHKAQVNDRNEH